MGVAFGCLFPITCAPLTRERARVKMKTSKILVYKKSQSALSAHFHGTSDHSTDPIDLLLIQSVEMCINCAIIGSNDYTGFDAFSQCAAEPRRLNNMACRVLSLGRIVNNTRPWHPTVQQLKGRGGQVVTMVDGAQQEQILLPHQHDRPDER